MHVFEVVYGLLFVILLIIKYFKGREIDRQAVAYFIYGLWVLIGAGLLSLLVSLGSAPGGLIVGALGATASGVLLVLGLQTELLPKASAPPRAAAPREPVPPRAPAPAPPRRPPPKVDLGQDPGEV